jgi:hypothetical protein
MSTAGMSIAQPTSFGPCPRCQQEVTGVEAEPQYVVSNPDSVIRIGPDDCDGGEDCRCTVIANPSPSPLQNEYHCVATWITLKPCGDRFEARELRGWHAYTVTPSAGIVSTGTDTTKGQA